MKSALIAVASSLMSVILYAGMDRLETRIFPDAPRPICFRGIAYIEFPAGIVTERSADGTIATCKE